MDERRPLAFLSYAHFADNFDDGYLTQFCLRLSGEVCLQRGDDFPIFQDRKDISWGDCWKERINSSLDTTTFLIPVITPGFFKSEYCREELNRFLERETKLGLDDLILPIYYVDTPVLNDKKLQANDELAQIIASRQYADWRKLRLEEIISRDARKEISNLAAQICKSLSRLDNLKNIENDSNPFVMSPIKSPSDGRDATHPKAIVVDQMHPGDFAHPGEIATISQAIAVAAPGDKIIVRPGLYEEGIVIDKPLEIIGEGERDHIKIRAKGMHTIAFKAAAGRIANLSIMQMGGDEFCCVDISRGMLNLENCDISSQGKNGISIHNSADPRLRRNNIHNNKGIGVIVTENGQGWLEDNDIFENVGSSVEINEGCNLMLRRNRIHDGKSIGVCFRPNAEGILEENDIFGHEMHQVFIAAASNPTLKLNHIHDGKSIGVYFSPNARGILEENDIFGHEGHQVIIMNASNPTQRGNHIHEGRSGGVCFYTNAQGFLEKNYIFGHKKTQVFIKAGSNPMLRSNLIYNGKSNGVVVSGKGLGVFEDNDIYGHDLPQVVIVKGGNPTFRQNRIRDGKSYGIYIPDKGKGLFELNDLRGNMNGAWCLSENSKLKVKRINNIE
jgi:parallel beta-helix repeat protein